MAAALAVVGVAFLCLVGWLLYLLFRNAERIEKTRAATDGQKRVGPPVIEGQIWRRKLTSETCTVVSWNGYRPVLRPRGAGPDREFAVDEIDLRSDYELLGMDPAA
jgi:hypothetical protein